MFTWKDIYHELAKALLPFKSKQTELISMLRELNDSGIPTIALGDQGPGGADQPLKEIDPFTFFASFNRNMTDANRIAHLKYFSKRLGLTSPLPDDFKGIPIANAMKAWFFPYATNRGKDDISNLWGLAEAVTAAGPDKLPDALFDSCLEIQQVAAPKLTMGMFWLNPNLYLSTDAVMRDYLKRQGLTVNVTDSRSYKSLLQAVKSKFGSDFVSLSYSAWLGVTAEKPHYWAGGSTWGDESKVEEFTKGNFWEIGYEKDDPKPAAQKTWKAFAEIKVGDEFAIKGFGGQNDLRVYYVGKVIHKSDEDGILKLQKLDRPLFRGKAPKGPGWFVTLVPITEQSAIDAIFHGQDQNGPTPPEIPRVPSPLPALNTILYGPPGTGKTYETIERAVRTIEPGFQGEDHAAYKARFDELRAKDQIEFITFHQSYSYEDFVEGLRPVVIDEESSEAGYKYAPGIFKSFALRALFDCLQPATGVISFPALWDRLLEQIENDPDKEYPGLKKASYRLSLTPKGNLEGTNVTSTKTTKPFFCSKTILEKVFAAKPDADSITTADVTEVIEPGCHSHFVAAMFNELKRIQKHGLRENPASRNTPLPQKTREEIALSFLQNTDRGAYTLKPLTEPRPAYVLVIDEINRGNISKILGELITLLEPDKRLGAAHELRVKLPYTKHYFGVPSNLHILGTMNTADKSIALVDVALRRRFDFEELRPNFAVCESLPPAMRQVLESLNRRICLRKDRDHQIGHSYFMNVANEDAFNLVFARHVIPLLQEYFYNDWEGLRFVLGVQNKPSTLIVPLKDGDSGASRSSWQWSFEMDNKKASDETFFQKLAGNGSAA